MGFNLGGIGLGTVGAVAGGIFGGPIGAMIGGSIGAGIGGQADANSANMNLATDMNSFTEMMSNTAYQRSVADMKAAGINPMLAATNGGASTPSAAGIPMQSTMSGVGTGVSSAIDGMRTIGQLNLMQKQGMNTDADTALKASTASLQTAQTAKTLQDAKVSGFEGDLASKAMKYLNMVPKAIDSITPSADTLRKWMYPAGGSGPGQSELNRPIPLGPGL